MLIGRRRYRQFQKNHGLEKLTPPRVVSLDRMSFQTRYTVFLLATCAGAFLFFAGPAAYLLKQNQNLFQQLAYQTAPDLVRHLEREAQWMFVFLGVAFLLVAAATVWLGHRLTQHLLIPLQRLENHLDLSLEKNWTLAPLAVRNDEDFQKLFETYNRFYLISRERCEQELAILEKMTIDASQRQNWILWNQLVQEKRKSLGIRNASPEPGSDANGPQRRAS